MENLPQKSNSFVLFGASGDLSFRKLMPAWFYLERSGKLDDSLKILAVARQDISTEQFQEKVVDALNMYVSSEYFDVEVCNKLIKRIDYCCCDLKNNDNFQKNYLT